MAEPLRFRDDEPVDHPAVTVDAFGGQANAAAVRVEPGDDARALIPHLAHIRLVEVNFPAFTDGRGYSAARCVRQPELALRRSARWPAGRCRVGGCAPHRLPLAGPDHPTRSHTGRTDA